MVQSNTRGSRLRVGRVWLVGLVVGVLCVGCEPPDWKNPDFVSKQIESGDRLKALQELPKLSEEDQKKVVPALVTAYNNNLDKEKAFNILAEMRDKRAKSVYVDALKHSKSNRDKSKAAIALGDIKATEHIPTMIDMFKNVPNEDLRRSILEAFSGMPDSQQIPLLVDILTNYDPDREPIAYHAFACEILAAIDQPTDTVVKAVVFGMYLDNAKGQNVAKECTAAVATTGKLAVPELSRVLAGKHDKIKQRFAKYSTYIVGTAEVNASDALGLLHHRSATPALLAALVEKRDAPPTYRNDRLLAWGQKRNEFFVSVAESLGRIGDPAALETLSKFVVPSDKDLEPYKAIIDYDKRMKLFMVESIVKSINTLGDRGGLPALANGATKGNLDELKGYGGGAEYQSRWQAARAYAMLATGDNMAEWEKMTAAEKEEGMKKKFAEFKPAIQLAITCGKDAACYGGKIGGDSAIEAEKAAWELGRMEKKGAAEAQLIKHLGNASPELRTVVIESLFRVGGKVAADAIVETLKKEEGRATPEFKILHVKMKALKAFLDNQAG